MSLSVPAEAGGQRLDLFVGHALGLSRARLKVLFEADAVKVDGRRAKKGQTVHPGQSISLAILSEHAPAAAAEPGATLVVLHEDPDLVFVDKPSGRASHPLRPGEMGTVANALVALYPECAGASEDPREGGLCHRLDIDTSGVILAARSRDAWEKVRAAFAGRTVDKRYLAMVTGPLAEEGEIDLPLRHHPRHPDRVEPCPAGGPGAREARSRFRVLARAGEHALVEVRIITGVLHQVRAHLSAIGAPLVGDALYGGRPEPGLSRFFLHARSLQLDHPTTGKRLKVESPIPPELEAIAGRHFPTLDAGG